MNIALTHAAVAFVTAGRPYRARADVDIVRRVTETTDDVLLAPNPRRSAEINLNDEMVMGLTESLRARVAPMPPGELESRVRAALDELAPVRVAAYLGVLVERRVRSTMRSSAANGTSTDPRIVGTAASVLEHGESAGRVFPAV
jgi:hypothetical protein